MKNIIFFVLFFIVVLTGCDDLFYETFTYEWEIPEEVNNEEDVYEILIRSEYNYRRDIGGDSWNYPHQTYYNETEGMDCEDTAIFGAYLHHHCLQDEDVYLVGLKSKWEGNPNHMIYRIGNTYYQSINENRGKEYPNWHYHYDVIEEWSFEDMMDYMNKYGRSPMNYRTKYGD